MNFSFNVNEEIFLVNNIGSLRQITRNKDMILHFKGSKRYIGILKKEYKEYM